MTDSEVRKVLKESKDSARAQGGLGGEQGGRPGRRGRPEGAGQAPQRGGPRARLQELSTPCSSTSTSRRQEQVLKLFDELDELTREPFRAAKAEIDAQLAANATASRSTSCGPGTTTTRSSRSRRPSSTADLDAAYAKADILKLCREFYAGIGLPIDDVIARSDLYEKPGKSPHAFCTDIDREGDVRVLANIVPNEYWMGTMLHELGPLGLQQQEHPRERALRAPRPRRTS